MNRSVLLAPAPLDGRSGGYEYNRRIAAALCDRGWPVSVRALDPSFPRPTSDALDHAARELAAIDDRTPVIIDGLAFGAMPAVVEREASRLRLIALVHLPLAQEIGIESSDAARFEARERRALAAATSVVVTGTRTVPTLTRYGVRQDRIAVVEPGTDPAPLARGSGHSGSVHLVSVSAVTAGKGYELLVRALAAIPHAQWRLTCAGSLERDPRTVAHVRDAIAAASLADRIVFAGELRRPALDELYDSADVFVHASLSETYGMAVAEALARGLPVVGTATGAIPDLVGADAGILVEPGDVGGLAAAVERAAGDRRARARMAEVARKVRLRLSSWDDAAARFERVLSAVDTR